MARRLQDRTLRRDIQHLLSNGQGPGVVRCDVTKEGPNRGEARVSRAGPISPVSLHVLQEPQHDLPTQIPHLKTTRFSFGAPRSVEHQEPQRVPIGGHSQGTHVALFDEATSEKRLQEASQTGRNSRASGGAARNG